MILFGNLLLDGGDGVCQLSRGTVRVDDDVIAEVNVGDDPASYDLGGPDALITPGFIDAHLHLPQFDLIGAHGMDLLQWLTDVTFPSEMKWADTDFARGMTGRVAKKLLASGTTGIAAYATAHHDATVVAIETASAAGLRGVIGQVLMDREAPAELCFDADRLIDEAAALQSQFPVGGRLAAAVTPRFAIACTGGLLNAAGKLARETGATVQTHLAETIAECNRVAELFDGQRYVDVYNNAGLLGPTSIMGHGIHLDDADRRSMVGRGAAIAHCPTANSFLRSGIMPRHDHLCGGVKLTIGSDIGAGYETSMVRVARAMIEAAAAIGGAFPSAAEGWHVITAGNADALGWNDAGRIKIGGAADLVIVKPDVPWLSGVADPLSRLMFGWDDHWIDATMVRGIVEWPRNKFRQSAAAE